MRRRLVISYLLLMVLVLARVGDPAGASPWPAGRPTGSAPTGSPTRPGSPRWPGRRCATAGPARSTRELTSYDELYGDRRRGRRPGPATSLVGRRRAGRPARRPRRRWTSRWPGSRPAPPESVWPWTTDPMVVAVPINDGGEVLGAVVIVTPAGPRSAGPSPPGGCCSPGSACSPCWPACSPRSGWPAGCCARSPSWTRSPTRSPRATGAPGCSTGWARRSCAGSRPASTTWPTWSPT